MMNWSGKAPNFMKTEILPQSPQGPAACFMPIPNNHIPLNTLTLSYRLCLGIPNGFFSSGFLTKNL